MPEEVDGRVGMLPMARERFFTLRELDASVRAGFGAMLMVARGCVQSLCASWDSGVDFIPGLKGDRGSVEFGDSGEELGDGSVTDGESKVDIVVVSDESVESDETEAALPCL
jgi:hypothetical protein